MQTNGKSQISTSLPPRYLTSTDWESLISRFGFLKVEALELETEFPAPSRFRHDAYFCLRYGNFCKSFIAEYKSNWDERTFQYAIDKLAPLIPKPGKEDSPYPMVVLPYLDHEKLGELERRQISGLDLCGNGLIIVPGHWLIRSTGNKNRFRVPQAVRNPYKGKASLVGRTLLRRPAFRKLEDLQAEINQRGGNISLAVISRTVQHLEEELVVKPLKGNKVYLVNPEQLLNKLTQAYPYDPFHPRVLWRGNVDLPPFAFVPLLFNNARFTNVDAMMTGIDSSSRYASVAISDIVYVYAKTADSLLFQLPNTPGERFVNLEIQSPIDEAAFFDKESDNEGVSWASPIQSYIEMTRSNDVRLHETALQIKKKIFSELNQRILEES